ncbi:MAG: hypothetical protein ACNJA3_28780 (plasmid) [Pseudomonas rhizophila]|uniref:hypothetical protein n=1 Tax=Pseudomonas rhizophila TaxID=2045200 RepID=UPI003F6B9DF4
MKAKLAICLSCLLAFMAIAHGAITLTAGDEVVIPTFAILIGLATLVLLWWGNSKRRT